MHDPRAVADGLYTVRDLIRYGVSRFTEAKLFFGHGSDNAWDEAVYLVLHALSLPPDQLEPFLDARLLLDEREHAISLIHRRCESRLPAPYLTQESWLQGYRFFVDTRVIVPRSPIAELLGQQLQPWINEPASVESVLDMCTGSGCLAIIAAHEFPHAQVDAVDVSSDALEVAAINVREHGLEDRVTLIQSNLFASIPDDRRYDLIICNPPYVNSQSMSQLPAEYQHEPHQALAGGSDGMDLVREILRQAPYYMTDQACLVLEIGHEIEHFEAAFPEIVPIWLDAGESNEQILLLHRDQLLT